MPLDCVSWAGWGPAKVLARGRTRAVVLPGEFTLATWQERREETQWERGKGEAWAQASPWAQQGGVGNNKLLSSFHR